MDLAAGNDGDPNASGNTSNASNTTVPAFQNAPYHSTPLQPGGPHPQLNWALQHGWQAPRGDGGPNPTSHGQGSRQPPATSAFMLSQSMQQRLPRQSQLSRLSQLTQQLQKPQQKKVTKRGRAKDTTPKSKIVWKQDGAAMMLAWMDYFIKRDQLNFPWDEYQKKIAELHHVANPSETAMSRQMAKICALLDSEKLPPKIQKPRFLNNSKTGSRSKSHNPALTGAPITGKRGRPKKPKQQDAANEDLDEASEMSDHYVPAGGVHHDNQVSIRSRGVQDRASKRHALSVLGRPQASTQFEEDRDTESEADSEGPLQESGHAIPDGGSMQQATGPVLASQTAPLAMPFYIPQHQGCGQPQFSFEMPQPFQLQQQQSGFQPNAGQNNFMQGSYIPTSYMQGVHGMHSLQQNGNCVSHAPVPAHTTLDNMFTTGPQLQAGIYSNTEPDFSDFEVNSTFPNQMGATGTSCASSDEEDGGVSLDACNNSKTDGSTFATSSSESVREKKAVAGLEHLETSTLNTGFTDPFGQTTPDLQLPSSVYQGTEADFLGGLDMGMHGFDLSNQDLINSGDLQNMDEHYERAMQGRFPGVEAKDAEASD